MASIEPIIEPTKTEPTKIEDPESSERVLARFVRLDNVIKHPNADRLSIAQISGWDVVIGLDYAKQGDIGVYFEIDSVIPKQAEWAQKQGLKSYTIKTIKLRDVLSQGLFIKMCELPFDDCKTPEDEERYLKLENATNLLGITKRKDTADTEHFSTRKGKRDKVITARLFSDIFPKIPKTDEVRIQSYKFLLDEMKGLPFYATIKYDGSSSTVDRYSVCSRNYEASNKTHFTDVVEKYELFKKLADYPNIVLQYEVYGTGIQGNKLKVTEGQRIAVFSVWETSETYHRRRFGLEEMRAFLLKIDVPMAEVVVEGDSFEYTMDEIKALSKGFYPETTNHREGLVFRPKEPIRSERLRQLLSFKIINDDHLLATKQ